MQKSNKSVNLSDWDCHSRLQAPEFLHLSLQKTTWLSRSVCSCWRKFWTIAVLGPWQAWRLPAIILRLPPVSRMPEDVSKIYLKHIKSYFPCKLSRCSAHSICIRWYQHAWGMYLTARFHIWLPGSTMQQLNSSGRMCLSQWAFICRVSSTSAILVYQGAPSRPRHNSYLSSC